MKSRHNSFWNFSLLKKFVYLFSWAWLCVNLRNKSKLYGLLAECVKHTKLRALTVWTKPHTVTHINLIWIMQSTNRLIQIRLLRTVQSSNKIFIYFPADICFSKQSNKRKFITGFGNNQIVCEQENPKRTKNGTNKTKPNFSTSVSFQLLKRKKSHWFGSSKTALQTN